MGEFLMALGHLKKKVFDISLHLFRAFLLFLHFRDGRWQEGWGLGMSEGKALCRYCFLVSTND